MFVNWVCGTTAFADGLQGEYAHVVLFSVSYADVEFGWATPIHKDESTDCSVSQELFFYIHTGEADTRRLRSAESLRLCQPVMAVA